MEGFQYMTLLKEYLFKDYSFAFDSLKPGDTHMCQ